MTRTIRLRPLIKLIIGLSVWTVAFASTALAESTVEAMKIFGLIGIWSSDCAKDATHDGGRITYSVPQLGAPTLSELAAGVRGGVRVETRQSGIVTLASRLTEEKLKLVTRISSGSVHFGTSELTPPLKGIDMASIIIKVGSSKIRIIDSRSVDNSIRSVKGEYYYAQDGNKQWIKTNYETPVLEKCLS